MQATMALPNYWPASHWALPGPPVGAETGFTFETGGHLAVDERAQLFFLGCAPAKKPGAATISLAATTAANGVPLQGGKTYHLRVPPNVPAKQFWAVTVYDFETAAFVREAPRVELNSYDQKMQKNADGSVDVYFGPAAPARQGSQLDYHCLWQASRCHDVGERHQGCRRRTAANRPDPVLARRGHGYRRGCRLGRGLHL
jgi:hypothetical protein